MRSMVMGASATADILQAPWTTEEHGPAAGTISKPDNLTSLSTVAMNDISLNQAFFYTGNMV
ncbi:hypothetical protein LK430_10605 [Acidaminococcus fermentans DSM 20731]|uniref:hypothetical protein n=1 Tax=Acidaminococcus fermentans TaxID=905 RepID=UPI0011D0C6D8|nr:hypothetical protein [Acidaminococcus fermentans]UEA72281.1 hypothetical protein LK430_10605 [Acidaminococcus fermentans DSM 20731]